jgi:hypothetical protein
MLVALCGRKLSFSEILQLMTKQFPDAGIPSRNAVIARAHRIGVSNNRLPTGRLGERTRDHRLRKKSSSPSLPPSTSASTPTPSIWDAGPHQCRWPITEVRPIEAFRFCGAPTLPECSYCAAHWRKSRSKQQVVVIEDSRCTS